LAIIDKVIRLDGTSGEARQVHRTVATRFSVEVRFPGLAAIAMKRVRFGVVNEDFVQTDFLVMRRGEAIPTGAIFAKLIPRPQDPLVVDVAFRVRTGRHFTGSPEFSSPAVVSSPTTADQTRRPPRRAASAS
jgi:hypothetical protein